MIYGIKFWEQTSHVVVSSINQTTVENYNAILEKVLSVTGVTAAAPFIINQVMLINGDRVSGVVVRGVDPEKEGTVSDLEKNMIVGSIVDLKVNFPYLKDRKLEDKKNRTGIILGKELSRKMGVVVGDVVSMVSPVSRVTPIGLIPRMKLF